MMKTNPTDGIVYIAPQQYFLLRADHPDRLAEIANDFLAVGWIPQGGVSAIVNSAGCLCFQAFTHHDKAAVPPYQ